MKLQIAYDMLKAQGLTFIEAMFTVVIIGIILVVSLGGYQQYQRRSNINSNVFEIASYLERARVLSLVSYDSEQYGIHFDENQYVLFQAPTYSSGDPDNEVQKLSGFRFDDPQVFYDGPGLLTSDVLFVGLSGQTNNTGTIRLRSTADPNLFKLITINELGTLSIQ